MAQFLNILLVEPNATKALEISEALQKNGWSDVTVIGSNADVPKAVTDHDPDLILIDLANPDRDTLEHLSITSQAQSRPVALLRLPM